MMSKRILRAFFRWTLRIILWLLLTIFTAFVALVIALQTPWGQRTAIGFGTDYFYAKTGSTLFIKRISLSLDGNFSIKQLYLEDQNADTLVYSSELSLRFRPGGLLTGDLAFDYIRWKGLHVHVSKDLEETWNFQNLIDAFSGAPDSLETNTDPLPKLRVKEIALDDFHLTYSDLSAAVYANAHWTQLLLKPKQINLNKNLFDVHQFDWSNLHVIYHESQLVEKEIDHFESQSENEVIAENDADEMLFLRLRNLAFKNISWDIILADGMESSGDLGAFKIVEAQMSTQKKWVQIESIKLSDNQISLKIPPTPNTSIDTANNPIEIAWPEWLVNIQTLDISNTDFQMQTDTIPLEIGKFHPGHFHISDFNTRFTNLKLERKFAGFDLNSLRFAEHSGFRVQQFEGAVQLSQEHLSISGMRINTGHLAAVLEAEIDFLNLNELANSPEKSIWEVLFKIEKLAPGDLTYFMDVSVEDSLPDILKTGDTRVELQGNGDENLANLKSLKILVGQETVLNARSQIAYPFDTAKMKIAYLDLDLTSGKSDLGPFIQDTSLTPDFVNIQAHLSGNLQQLTGNAKLKSDLATLDLIGNISHPFNHPDFAAEVDLEILKPERLSGSKDLSGKPKICMQTSGQYKKEILAATGSMQIHNLEYAKYQYNPIILDATIKDTYLEWTGLYKDRFLDLSLESNMHFNNNQTIGQLDLHLQGADLYSLKLTEDDIRIQGQISSPFKFSSNSWDVSLAVTEGIILKQRQAYPVGLLNASARSSEVGTFLELESGILDLTLNSNMDAGEIPGVLSEHFANYFNDKVRIQSGQNRFLNLEGHVKNSLILRDILIPGLDELEPGRIAIHFDESKHLFDADIKLPGISYQGVIFEDWRFTLDTQGDSLGFQMSLKGLESGPFKFYDTRFAGEVDQNHWDLFFSMDDSLGARLFHLETALGQSDEGRALKVGQSLILNREAWQVNPENLLIFHEHYTEARQFHFTRDLQRFGLQNPLDSTHVLSLVLEQFRMETLFGVLNPESPPVTGTANGRVNFISKGDKQAFSSDLQVDSLSITGISLGTLNIDAENTVADTYDLLVTLIGEGVNAQIAGQYLATELGNRYAIDGDIQEVALKLIAAASDGAFSNARGSISSQFSLRGGGDEALRYSGFLQLNDAKFTIRDLNTDFTFSDERIQLSDNIIELKNFTIRDKQSNLARINGQIDITNPFAPQFQVDLDARNFQLLDTRRTHNDLFFGKLLVDLNLTLTGNATRPLVQTRLKLNKGTSLNFIIPESELAEIEREGVVQFANVRNPDDPLTGRIATSQNSNALNLDLKAQIEVDRETEFRVIVDERSGDFLQMRGAAALLFDMSPNGRMNLSGQYEITDGRYELSFYDLVRRRFDFRSGSTINWNGDPLDAILDLTAVYQVRAAPRDLMTSQLTGVDQTTRTKYNQELPFEVFLMIDGEMIRPRIRFKLDMPQNSRGELGGNVYARVQQLNEDESALNKQVFALLVINGFIPETGGTATGATSSMVRSSVSQLLSDQLNTLSGKFVKGVDLDLGLDSYTDYRTGAAQERTQLNVNVSKQLLDDRLIIAVGSNVDLEGERAREQQNVSDIIGNISVEYLLSQEGHYRLKAFRRNQFEGVLDGQLITTGVSIRYNKEFNRFKELWRKEEEPAPKKEENKKPDE
jgi:translocation and assembly module TamB